MAAVADCLNLLSAQIQCALPTGRNPKMAVPNYSIIGRLCAMNVTIGCRLCSALATRAHQVLPTFVIRCQAEFGGCLRFLSQHGTVKVQIHQPQ